MPISGLNEQQLEAALDTEGAVLVTAGAGSGKTRLLTKRIAHIIEDLGVPAYNVLAITFTNKAADEMRDRLFAIAQNAQDIWIATFHSTCAKILRRYATRLGYASNFTIYAEEDSERAVKQIVKDMQIDEDGFHKKCLRAISDAKNRGLSPDEYRKENKFVCDVDVIADVYEEYEAKLRNNNAMDFDDLLTKTDELFSVAPDVLEYYQDKFRYIHVDEFQDTNAIQYGLVKKLAGKHGNVFVVGDEDQSIYGWRGADVTNMQSFIEDFGATIYKLEQNYRSTKNILEAANNLIKNNVSRIEKRLWSELGDGEKITAYRAENESEEADFVVNTINKLLRSGYRPHDFAVLMRVNALTRLVEQRCMQYGLPYKVYGGFKFFDRKEVKDIIAYLRVLSNPADEEALLRIINFPKRGIGDGTVNQMQVKARESNVSLLYVIENVENEGFSAGLVKKVKPLGELLSSLAIDAKNLNVAELVAKVIQCVAIKEAYAEDTEENVSRKLNIDDFVSSANEFTTRRGGTLDEFLEEVMLYTEGDDETRDCIFLSTVHSAKGMEFRNVFVIGVEENLFPLSRANDSESELEEERRLMYVAVTRAKERLYFTYCASRFMYGDRKYCQPSRFLSEIDQRLVGNRSRQFAQKPAYFTAQNAVRANILQNSAVQRNNNVQDFVVGTRVMHKKFGEGVVESVSNVGANSYVSIKFDSIGTITLSLAFAPIQKL